MIPPWVRRGLTALALAAGLTVLYAPRLSTGFLNDDYLFLEQARTQPLAESLTRLDALGNYWRPLSRQLYFAALGNFAGGEPWIFHAFNFAVFLGALILLADLLAVLVPAAGVLAGVLFFALLPMQSVNLVWISCAQDLLALFFSLAAVAFWRRERRGLAVAAYALAITSKEVALPLPLALVAWDIWITRREGREAARRQLPAAAVVIAWAIVVLWVRSRSAPQAVFRWSVDGLLATYAHLAQSFLGIEHPPGFLAAFTRAMPPLVPLVLLAVAAWLAYGARGGASEPAPAEPAPFLARPAVRFALVWIAVFGLVTWPVVHIWCGYYYTLAAVGAALLVAQLARNSSRVVLVALAAGLLWWHAAGTSMKAFAVTNHAWGWTSHLTTFYFTRGAELASAMTANLRTLEPSPAAHTRFFFATLPPYAGFQMGNGALIRASYRDPSIQSHFYSRFSDSTAAAAPCRFYHWDGAELRPLYPGLDEPFFQVGCDLLLLDRPAGAAHAFRRSLAAGGSREDNLYWLGWAALWSGDRHGAEQVWQMFGAKDDPRASASRFLEVRETLYQRRDTLTARRQLMEAIRSGIGSPHSHAILGELLLAEGGIQAKYGLLELKVATSLNPNDLLARRELVTGLAAIGMDDAARAALESLRRTQPAWHSDTALARVAAVLEERRARTSDVAEFR